VFLNTCKDIGLAVNTGKTKYIEIGRRGDMLSISGWLARSSYGRVSLIISTTIG
jgi:hypothetical protein